MVATFCVCVCARVCVCGSVLMADVMGLTALSQDCTAAEMVRMLNELFGRFDQLATVYTIAFLCGLYCALSVRLSICLTRA